MTFFVLYCADSGPHNEEMQRLLMKLFFADITDDGKRALSTNAHPNDDYLIWFGVNCHYGLVATVEYHDLIIGNFNIHAMPNSTGRISVCRCRQKYPLKTRMLPRNLTYLFIDNNKIFGVLDLTTLPTPLRELSASANKICGPVDLTHLPPHLKTLNLCYNRISQKVVLYGNLPRKIESISLYQRHKLIRGVRAIEPDQKLSNQKASIVFCGMRHM